MAEARATIGDLAQQALALGIARYLHDHPEAVNAAASWMNDDVDAWRKRSTADIAQQASDRLADLEGWRASVESNSDAWNADRVNYVHAKLTLQSARTGSFQTAAGSLFDFLREVGAPAEELDIH